LPSGFQVANNKTKTNEKHKKNQKIREKEEIKEGFKKTGKVKISEL
jgi:hypothetical protein